MSRVIVRLTGQGRGSLGAAATIRAAAAAVVLLSSTLSPAVVHASDHSKLSPALAQSLFAAKSGKRAPLSIAGMAGTANTTGAASSNTAFRVLVRYTQNNDATFAARGAASGVKAKVARYERSLRLLGVSSVTVTLEQLEKLLDDPSIETISPNLPVALTAELGELDVNPRAMGADAVWPDAARGYRSGGVNGAGITVAILDSGVAPAKDLHYRLIAFKDFVNGRTAPYDDHGHGTHVAGIVAGSGASSSGLQAKRTYRGVAPGAGLVVAKVLDAQGGGNVADVLAGIEWCIANRTAYNIRVMSLSLGHAVMESYKTDPLCQAVQKASEAGIVVVASAGNRGGGYGGVGSPGNAPSAITVGAANTRQTVERSDDVITTYTSRGPTRYDFLIKPDLVAPGNKVVSVRAPGSTLDTRYPETRVEPAVYLNDPDPAAESSYASLSGSSMATPAVAGAVALALEANPYLTPYAAKAAVMYSAQRLSGPDPVWMTTITYDPCTQGAGLLNVPGLIETVSLLRPDTGFVARPSLKSFIAGEPVVWMAASITAENPTWGGALLFAENASWGSGDIKLWGDNASWGSGDVPKLWGDNWIWGSGLLYAENASWGSGDVKLWGDGAGWNGRMISADNASWGSGDLPKLQGDK